MRRSKHRLSLRVRMTLQMLETLFRGTRGMQYVAVAVASLVAASLQMYGSWSSPTLPKLTGANSPLGEPISDEVASWLVSTMSLSSIPGAVTYHLTTSRFGRKQLLFASAVAFFLPWLLIFFGDHIAYVFAARCLAGLMVEIAVITVIMYSSEVADVDIRGRLCTTYNVMKVASSVLVLAVGPFLSYRFLAVICALVPLALFGLLFVIPESPYTLVRMNRVEEARRALRLLTGTPAELEIDERMKTISAYLHTSDRFPGLRAVLANRRHARVIAIVNGVITLQYLGGYGAIVSYQQEIIAGSASGISPEVSSVAFGLIQIPAALLSAFLVDRLGRKVIVYVGCTGCAAALLVEGAFFYVEDYVGADVSAVSWVPTTGLVVFLTMHAVQASVPYILLGEFFPDAIRPVAMTIFATLGATAIFVVSKTYQPLRVAFGLYTVFWIYAFFNVATALATYCFLIETKNKTFEEIEKEVYM